MLKEKLLDNVLISKGNIEINQSRCSRMRFNKSSCNRCVEICQAKAITIGEGIIIDESLCSECMLCVSTCSSDCFEINRLDFYSLIARLKKMQSPVLSCNRKTDLKAHEKTLCLGFLSEEHIVALLTFIQEPLQINLTECKSCGNRIIVDALKKRLDGIRTKNSYDVLEKIRLVENESDLDYRQIAYDRRGFFREVKDFTFLKTARLFNDSPQDEAIKSYSSKKLPFKRELLNRTLNVFSGEERKNLLDNYYYTITVDGGCSDCYACVGMCPTGALKIDRDGEGSQLVFKASLCNGCGLCEGFCTNNSIYIKQGFSGHNPFEFINMRENYSITSSAGFCRRPDS